MPDVIAPHLRHTVAGLERMLHHWGALLHRRPWVAGGLVLVVLGFLAWPVMSLRTGDAQHRDHPAVARPPAPAITRSSTPSDPAPPAPCPSSPRPDCRPRPPRCCATDRGIAATHARRHAPTAGRMTLAIPTTDASAKATGATIDRLRPELPAGSLIGGAAAENHDLEKALSGAHPAGVRAAHRPRLPAPAGRPRQPRWSRSSVSSPTSPRSPPPSASPSGSSRTATCPAC